jgi:hypothetical protein
VWILTHQGLLLFEAHPDHFDDKSACHDDLYLRRLLPTEAAFVDVSHLDGASEGRSVRSPIWSAPRSHRRSMTKWKQHRSASTLT